MKRILIVVLALLIGSPVCWCCVSHGASVTDDPNVCPMCAESESAPDKNPCPCDQGCSARGLSQPDVSVPAPAQTWVAPFAWVFEEAGFLVSPQFVRLTDEPLHETGPPPPGRALYQVHCALLN